MSDFERRLRDLGLEWDVPPTPDIAGSVTARLADHPAPARPRLGRRRRLVVIPGFALVAAGMLAAIAPAREAVLDLFEIGGETIRPVPTLPPARTAIEPQSDLGERVTVAEVRERSPFAIRAPAVADLGPPDEVYRLEPPPGGLVSFVWRARPGLPKASATGAGLLMTQVTGTAIPEKGLDPSAVREEVRVDGKRGLWITGGPHVLGYLDERDQFRTETTRLAGNVLVWSEGAVTYRLEGDISRDRAVEIAESVE